MTSSQTTAKNPESFLHRYRTLTYFLLTYFISWVGALCVAVPGLLRGQGVSKTTGIAMFPAMLLGPSVSGIAMTFAVQGGTGIRDLFRRMRAVSAGWCYAALLLPPLLVLTTLALLSRLFSTAFSPNHFYLGILFGIPAGFFEEIGWTGFALPQMLSQFGFLKGVIVLGVLWGAWHLPVINYLGAATPHGTYWLPFLLAFVFVMTAMRVLIAWLYVNTRSVLLTQLMHMSSTGALVVFSPAVTPAQEVAWYAIYGCVLWIFVAAFAAIRQFRIDPLSVTGIGK